MLESFQNFKVAVTIATVFLYSIPAQPAGYRELSRTTRSLSRTLSHNPQAIENSLTQPAGYRELSRTASEIFLIIIKISVNHFYDFHKTFSGGWVEVFWQ